MGIPLGKCNGNWYGYLLERVSGSKANRTGSGLGSMMDFGVSGAEL
jgi:hypothetical protein